MFLSTEQTRAAMHGLAREEAWEECVRPVGPQPIPDWCKGVHVYWAEGFCTSPSVRLKTVGEVRDWHDKRFEKTGDFYRARHPDGRMEQYAHNGPVALREMKMWQRADGSLHQYPRTGIDKNGRFTVEPGEWVSVKRMATTPQGGCGGAVIWLKMLDGSDLALCGPWHVGAPAGFAEVAYVDVSEPDVYRRRKGFRWHDRTARAGLYLRHDVFVTIMARFAPHLPLATVTYGGSTSIEPYTHEWGEPKHFHLSRTPLPASGNGG